LESILNIDTVFDPGLTATRLYIDQPWSFTLMRATLTLPATLTAPWLKRPSGAAGAPVESTPFIPAPPVAVIDPSERVPSAATFNATMELLAVFVMKYTAFAFVEAAPVPAADPVPFPLPWPLLPVPLPLLVQISLKDMAWPTLIVWPPMVMLPPSSLIVNDPPLVPNGTVSGAAEAVSVMAKLARIESK
jgi:hypothetical protein